MSKQRSIILSPLFKSSPFAYAPPGVYMATSILLRQKSSLNENIIMLPDLKGIVDGSSYCLLLNDEVCSNTAKP